VIAEEKREEFFTIKCLKCGYKKRYPTKNYKLWLEKEESNVQDVQEKPQKAPFVQKVGQGKNKKSKKKHGKIDEMEVEQQIPVNPEILKKEQN
jgi:RNase P subunit RPR2